MSDFVGEPPPASLPIGRSGRLEAMALSTDEDAAVLVRERATDGRARALTGGPGPGTPPAARAVPADVPIWASVAGGALLLIVVAFAVIGSAVVFAWIAALLT